jgi:hypothetical protein
LAEMPAGSREIEQARQEGILILPCRGPGRIFSRKGKVNGMELVECTGVFDERGNFCPQFSDKKECIEVEQVIMAVGQAVDLSFLDENCPIKVESGLIAVDGQTLETGMPGVYAGGDVIGAPASVIHAIAAGRRAAESIDKALGGCGDINETLFERGHPGVRLSREEGFAALARQKVPELDVVSRVNNFQEVALGYGRQQAVREAARCLQCDLRLNMGSNPAAPAHWLPFDEAHVYHVPEAEGVLQLADAGHHVLDIKGTANLRQALLMLLKENASAVFFEFEQSRMYSQRESELIQKYLQAYGEMPGSAMDDLDDLY